MPRPRKPASPFRYFNSSSEVIRLAVLMDVKYPLSLRNVEDLLHERGIDISYETVRYWWNRFGPMIAGDIRNRRVRAMRGFRQWRWHLDEIYVKVNGEMRYLWRAVDHEGEILESFVTRDRDKAAALKFMKKALKRFGSPNMMTTDGLRSYRAAMTELGNVDKQQIGRWANNRVENSHLPFRLRERAMQGFRRMKRHCQSSVARRSERCYPPAMSRKSRAKPPSPFRCFNSSPEVIRLVVMMYVRFPLSLRNVEDLLFERGVDICHETVRFWWNRFGPMFAGDIRRQRVSRMRGFRHWRWHLDEMYVKVNGETRYLWRAVDHEGEILESYITKTRDKAAALRFMKKALKRHGLPEAITTDGLRSYKAAMGELGNTHKQEIGRWANNRVENSHLPFRRRERAMLRFRQMKSLQKFASVHASFHNHFNSERHLVDRTTFRLRRSAALTEWQLLAN